MEWKKKIKDNRIEWVLPETPYSVSLLIHDMSYIGGEDIYMSKLFLDLNKAEGWEKEKKEKMETNRKLSEALGLPMNSDVQKLLMVISVDESKDQVIVETDIWTQNNTPPDITFFSEIDTGDTIFVETTAWSSYSGIVEEFRRLDRGESSIVDIHILCSGIDDSSDFVVRTSEHNLYSCYGMVHEFGIDEYEENLIVKELDGGRYVLNMLDNSVGTITGLSVNPC